MRRPPASAGIGIALVAAVALTAAATASGAASTPSPLPVTASTPPGLLAALHKAVGHVYSYGELVFTYRADPRDARWLSWLVMPAPGYEDTVQGGAGYAHRVGVTWEIWGPGTNLAGLGCSAQGALPAIPASVIEAFGQSCGSTVPAVTTTTAPAARAAPLLRYVGPSVITLYYGHPQKVSLAGDFVAPTNTGCDRAVSPTTCDVHGRSFAGPRVCAGPLPASAGFFHWEQPHVGRAGGLVRCTIVYTGRVYPVPYAGQPVPDVWKSNPSALFLYSSINGGTPLAGPFTVRFVLRKAPSTGASLQLGGTLSTGGLTVHLSGSSSPVFQADSSGQVQGSSTMQESVTAQGGTAGCTISGDVRPTVLYRWSGDVIDPRTQKARITLAMKGSATGSFSVVCNVPGQAAFSQTFPANAFLPDWATGEPVIVYLDDHSPQVILRDRTALGLITLTLTIPG